MTRLRVARVSPALLAGPEFCRAYGLTPYDPSMHLAEPTLFVGLYSSADLANLCEHEGPATLLFAGTDARAAAATTDQAPVSWCADVLRRRREMGRLRILAQPGIADVVRGIGLDATHAIYVGDPEPFRQACGWPPGKHLYAYCPYERRDEYGLARIAEVAAALPDVPVYLGRWGDHAKPFDSAVPLSLRSQAEMVAIYADCFAGIRTIERDAFGCANVELALMGRPVAHVIDVGVPWIEHAPDAASMTAFVRRARERRRADAALAASAAAHVAETSWLDS